MAKNLRSFLEMVFQICRVYTERIKDGKNKVRPEYQEYPPVKSSKAESLK